MPATAQPTPPVPPLTFRIGVSGHRPNRLTRSDPALLTRQIELVLQTVREATTQCAPKPTLRILSSLAEGADRLVAQAALDQGFALQVPLPFPRADYEADFETPASKQEFRNLLAQARDAVFELDPPTGERARGYRAAGEIVLDQCDLLVVIWDGEPSAGIGGTPELIDRALRLGRPVLRIDAVAPHPISFRAEVDPLAAIATFIRTLLTPPPAAAPFSKAYHDESWPKRNATTSYSFVRLMGSGRWRLARARLLTDPVPEIQTAPLQPYFQWADALANHYGELTRSAALRLQLLASASVVSGLLSIPFNPHSVILRVLATIEFATTVLLVFDAMRVARRPWHKRWLLYRSLAEQLRSLDFLAPLAQTIAPQTPTGFYSDEEGGTLFASFHLDAIVRHVGLLGARVDNAFLRERRAHLTATIQGQVDFQETASKRYENLETTLHRLGLVLFAVAAVLSLYDVAHAFGATDFDSPWMTTTAALLPALGSAFASIAAQGEYQRLASRARSMRRTLYDLLTTLANQPVSLASLAVTAKTVAEVLTSEVRDWQVLVSVRKPSLPV